MKLYFIKYNIFLLFNKPYLKFIIYIKLYIYLHGISLIIYLMLFLLKLNQEIRIPNKKLLYFNYLKKYCNYKSINKGIILHQNKVINII